MPDITLRAGASTSNITPPLGISLNGGMADRTAEYIHDELHARALVLDDGMTKLAIVVCDSCMLPQAVLNQAKHMAHGHTDIPMDRMTISATHTHTARPTAGSAFQSEPDAEYLEFLSVRISDAIRRAAHNLAPARVGWGMGREESQVFNRRWKMKSGVKLIDPFGRPDQVRMNPPVASSDLIEPAGPIDPEVSVLSVRTAEGKPLALLANYSLHYVGGTGPGEVSADYYGVFAENVTDMLARGQDPPFVAMMSNGTSGDINNINFRENRPAAPPYVQIRKVAHLLATEAVRVAGSIEYRPAAPLSVREARLRLARRATPKDEVARARFILSKASGPVLSSVEEIYARETVLLAQYAPVIETTVQALRIGELGIATSPCETFVETGLAIKAGSPLKPTFTIELANDYRGYLPTAEHHQLGGYETWRARSSYLEVDAEAKIRSKLLELLAEVAKS